MRYPVFLKTLCILAIFVPAAVTSAQQASPQPKPWSDASLSPDSRAALVLHEMTLEEKVSLLHGTSGAAQGALGAGSAAVQSNGGAGMFGGVPRLGIAPIQMADASYGVTHGRQTGRYATAMPSPLALAASWDPELAFDYGALIGRELRAHGYNMSLGGGVNLTREPRNGRTFEYLGEDPLLAGTLAGQMMRGEQAQNLLGDIKHFALNDQESGRNAADVTISERAMRETDLRAFEIGIRVGNPSAVMCSYNRVAGDYACENSHLLSDILKGEWGFKGFVLSDWGGTHSTVKSLRAGLDNEEPNGRWFGDPMVKAIHDGEVKEVELDASVLRILRSEFASGVIDHPMQRSVVDVEAGLAAAQHVAERSLVLLKNEHDLLPLDPAKIRKIALIGAHADVGMISGGGSAQVDPPGGNAVAPRQPVPTGPFSVSPVWFPTSPLRALRSRFPNASITFDSGDDVKHAAATARASDVVIVFGWQWEAESMDLETLALDKTQNDLIAAVAAANPRNVVVIESGGPVLMPWASKAGGIIEAWYGGSRGAEALVSVLAGDVNPSAKLPVSFPLSDADLPHPTLVKPPPESRSLPYTAPLEERQRRVLAPFPINYDEGLKVGYAWYDAEKKPVLFPFGFGLSYSRFAYSNCSVTATRRGTSLHFTLTNTGTRDGDEIAEMYAALPAQAGEPPKRLVAWKKVHVPAHESVAETIAVGFDLLSVYDESAKAWKHVDGDYRISVGGSSQGMSCGNEVRLDGSL